MNNCKFLNGVGKVTDDITFVGRKWGVPRGIALIVLESFYEPRSSCNCIVSLWQVPWIAAEICLIKFSL